MSVTTIADLDAEELACKIFEAGIQIKRPPGLTAKQALATMDPEDRAGWIHAANVAVEFVVAALAASGLNIAAVGVSGRETRQ